MKCIKLICLLLLSMSFFEASAIDVTSITLNETEGIMGVGTQRQLIVTVNPANATNPSVTWLSTNESVATVSSTGLVTAKSKGTAWIAATTNDGTNLTAVCKMTVKASTTSITLNYSEAELLLNHNLQLVATIQPSDAHQEAQWTSSNENVATVSQSGLVTPVSVGNAIIYASTIDGTNKKALCVISVLSTMASGIQLNQSAVNMHFGESSQLEAIISPMEASQDVAWTSSDPNVVTVDDNGLLFAKGLGQATVTASTLDGTNLDATCRVTVSHRYYCNNDVNRDGVVTAADVTALYDYLLLGDMTHVSTCDVNDDGTVTAADITAVYDEMLNGPIVNNNIKQFEVNGVVFKMIKVEGGTFTMGATPEQGSEARDDEKPAHDVTLSTFFIGQTEVTQELWQAVMGSNPSPYSGTNLPVSNVSWDNCQGFISKLNQMTGKTFRLPTEAEWEYAARGGNKSQGYKYSGSSNVDDVAWYSSNTTHTVASKVPNELGLYDMSGNVWEWCNDIYSSIYYTISPSTNPTGPNSTWINNKHVSRGGGVGFNATGCRVAYRDSGGSNSDADDGMRLVLSEE